MKGKWLLAAFTCFGLALYGCAENKPAEVNGPPAASVPASGDFMVDGKLTCPVMGGEIASKAEAAGPSVYKGKNYYFCCAECKPKFDTEPEEYADGKALTKEPPTL